jgi:hypothetical protein
VPEFRLVRAASIADASAATMQPTRVDPVRFAYAIEAGANRIEPVRAMT